MCSELHIFLHMHCHLRIRNLNSIFIQQDLDLFEQSPSGFPIFLILHPCTDSQYNRTVCQLMNKYIDLFVLDDTFIFDQQIFRSLILPVGYPHHKKYPHADQAAFHLLPLHW